MSGKVELTPEEQTQKLKSEEKFRLLELLFNNQNLMTAEYKQLVRHTGGIVAGSMTVAYSRAINDVIKFFLKEGVK